MKHAILERSDHQQQRQQTLFNHVNTKSNITHVSINFKNTDKSAQKTENFVVI